MVSEKLEAINGEKTSLRWDFVELPKIKKTRGFRVKNVNFSKKRKFKNLRTRFCESFFLWKIICEDSQKK